MATEALSYMGNIGELSGMLTGQSTVTDLAENRLDILQREYVWKVGNWPSAQRINQGKPRVWWLGPLTVSGEAQWNDAISQATANKKRVDYVNSWENVENIILQIRFSQLIRYGERISNRLSDLRRAVREEDGEISADSLRGFFSFLKMYPNIRYPDIALTPDGNIYARWKGDRGALFSVEFLPDSKVGYVVFSPLLNHAGELSRHSGFDLVENAFVRMNAAFAISEWVLE